MSGTEPATLKVSGTEPETSGATPETRTTGEQIRTPRGSFYVTDMTAGQMKEAGYDLHHTSEDGKYLIMGNGAQAFAIAADQPELPQEEAQNSETSSASDASETEETDSDLEDDFHISI